LFTNRDDAPVEHTGNHAVILPLSRPTAAAAAAAAAGGDDDDDDDGRYAAVLSSSLALSVTRSSRVSSRTRRQMTPRRPTVYLLM